MAGVLAELQLTCEVMLEGMTGGWLLAYISPRAD